MMASCCLWLALFFSVVLKAASQQPDSPPTCELETLSQGHEFLDEAGFKAFAKKNKLFIVGFSSSNCKRCCAFEPGYKQLVELLDEAAAGKGDVPSAIRKQVGKVKFVRVDVDKQKKLAETYNVNDVPSVVAVKDGKGIHYHDFMEGGRLFNFAQRLVEPLYKVSNGPELQAIIQPLLSNKLEREFPEGYHFFPNAWNWIRVIALFGTPEDAIEEEDLEELSSSGIDLAAFGKTAEIHYVSTQLTSRVKTKKGKGAAKKTEESRPVTVENLIFHKDIAPCSPSKYQLPVLLVISLYDGEFVEPERMHISFPYKDQLSEEVKKANCEESKGIIGNYVPTTVPLFLDESEFPAPAASGHLFRWFDVHPEHEKIYSLFSDVADCKKKGDEGGESDKLAAELEKLTAPAGGKRTVWVTPRLACRKMSEQFTEPANMWAMRRSLPLVGDFNPFTSSVYERLQTPMMLLVAQDKDTDTKDTASLRILSNVAAEVAKSKDEAAQKSTTIRLAAMAKCCGFLHTSAEALADRLANLGLSASGPFPALTVNTIAKSLIVTWQKEGERLSSDVIQKLVVQYDTGVMTADVAGEFMPVPKSLPTAKPVPKRDISKGERRQIRPLDSLSVEERMENLVKLTRDVFETMVMEETKDVAVFFYSSKNDKNSLDVSIRINRAWERFVELGLDGGLLMTRMDVATDQPPNYIAVPAVPSFFIFPAFDKGKPYRTFQEEGLTVKSLMFWIEKNVANKFPQPLPEDPHLDELELALMKEQMEEIKAAELERIRKEEEGGGDGDSDEESDSDSDSDDVRDEL
uniref:Thioredoxin domain-containing protein n=1 Tax=Chromera velia CCMP2878 TaxID=1169474 RepID=A0A0G4I6W4_9ALVE|eukprot:Cvel_11518.t1-p1 / transcript=Cvel_11518.t1 / gene=Cvel_11518 / organism=Chromera_velia_CCMP2878 / gene_product=hypothetical protein / transcript_product=hypothetical protein / location=Cvel_scaffold726:28130-32245(+) / protein_length=802 / sequence_SO=supercontig / SO=protein_coding / is_pseudo=false